MRVGKTDRKAAIKADRRDRQTGRHARHGPADERRHRHTSPPTTAFCTRSVAGSDSVKVDPAMPPATVAVVALAAADAVAAAAVHEALAAAA